MIQQKSKKRIPFTSENNKTKIYQFTHASALSPHPEKIDKGGQDALYVSKNILVIADGVGSWKQLGIDPGIYSKNLIKIIHQLILQKQKLLYYIQNPDKLAKACVQLNLAQGSTTLSILTLHPQSGLLRTYHIGDSIYGIFHSNKPPILGVEQQYFFNQPYQVGSNFINHQGQEMQFCNPEKGVYNQFSYEEVKDKVVVLASDGLWDNLFVKDIHQVIYQTLQYSNQTLQIKNQALQTNNQSLQINSIIERKKQALQRKNQIFEMNKITSNFISMIQSTYLIQQYESPFYLKGKQLGLNVGKFAKVDDLSIILAKIVERQIQN